MSTTPDSMQAAVCHGAGQPCKIETVPVPTLGPRHLLVRVKHASLCHSDLSILKGDFGTDIYPCIPGHEAIGVVEKIGLEAEGYGFKIGDIVGATLWHDMCLECSGCAVGPEFCKTAAMKGLSSAGVFAQYTLFDAAGAVKVQPSLCNQLPGGYASVAPIFCAGATAWDALQRADLKPDETAAVVGVGGVGQFVVKYGASLGIRMVALDIEDAQLLTCRGEGGACETIHIARVRGEALLTLVQSLTDGRGFDAIIVCSSASAAYNLSFPLLAPHGRLVVVGLPKEAISFPVSTITAPCASVIGSKTPGAAATKRCLDYSLRRCILAPVNPEKYSLLDINIMVERMNRREVGAGRMVIQFDAE